MIFSLINAIVDHGKPLIWLYKKAAHSIHSFIYPQNIIHLTSVKQNIRDVFPQTFYFRTIFCYKNYL